MPLVMQKFYEYYEEIYSEKDQKFIEETGRGKIMYRISNFSDNDDVKIITNQDHLKLSNIRET